MPRGECCVGEVWGDMEMLESVCCGVLEGGCVSKFDLYTCIIGGQTLLSVRRY